MGLQGYVGSGEDVRRIRRQEQQREEEKKKTEAEKQQREANVSAAGFRQFGKGVAEVCINLCSKHTFDRLRASPCVLCRLLKHKSVSKQWVW